MKKSMFYARVGRKFSSFEHDFNIFKELIKDTKRVEEKIMRFFYLAFNNVQ